MREDYKSINDVQLVDKKNYLLKLCQREELESMIYDCVTEQQLDNMLEIKRINKYLYIMALKALYRAADYHALEYHLIMMNALFQYQSYTDLKKELLQKMNKKRITVDEYCVIRHLIDFQNIPFHVLIERLHIDFLVDAEECAKICLIEDEYHEAYFYLRKLDNCENESLLQLLCSYSLYDYISLIRHYTKKKRIYQLIPSH